MKMKRFFALMLALALSLTMLQGVAIGAAGTLYSAQLVVPIVPPDPDKPEINTATAYMQIRVEGSKVVLGAGGSSFDTPIAQFVSCLQESSAAPTDNNDTGAFYGYSGVFDINEMYTRFKNSNAILATSGGTLTFPQNLAITEIGHGAFKEWKDLTEVIIPSSVTEIGSDAFAGSSVETVDFSRATNLDEINTSMFKAAQSLQSVDLSNTKITILGTETFLYCSALTSVKLPNTLERIGVKAFEGCTALTQITIPAGVNTITDNALDDSGLTSITFEGSNIGAWEGIGHVDDYTGLSLKLFNETEDLANIYFAGAYVDPDTATMAGALATALKTANKNPTIYYNDTWTQTQVDAFKQALIDGGLTSPNIKPYTVSTTGSSGGSTSGGAGVWYIGTGVPYTQIVDETATTAMLQQGSVVNVVGQSPTGIIVKFTPTALLGHSTVTINNSIGNVTLTATQIANLVQQADGGVIYITINQTADGVAVSATAGGAQVDL